MAKSKYFWGGDDPWPKERLLMPILFFGTIPNGCILYFGGIEGSVGNQFPKWEDLSLLMLGTAILIFLFWFNYLGAQNNIRVITGFEENTEKIAARILMNFVEQIPVILIILWVYAIAVNARIAGIMMIYIDILRTVYPYIYLYYGEQTVLNTVCTLPGYYMTMVCLVGIVCKLGFGLDLHAYLWGKSPYLCFAYGFVAFPMFFVMFTGGQTPAAAKAGEESARKYNSNLMLIPK